MSTEIWWIITTVAGLAITIIGFFLKRTINTTDRHDEAIHRIQLTYVTKAELQDIKNQLQTGIQGVASDVKEIKADSLTKDEFYRAIGDLAKQYEKLLDMHLNK